MQNGVLGNVYVGAAMSDKSGDKSELPKPWQFALVAAFIAHRSSNINVPLGMGVLRAPSFRTRLDLVKNFDTSGILLHL
jgi:hypothetical protein